MKKILLFQQFFPHYRAGTLQKICDIPDIEWLFAGMEKDPDEPSIFPWTHSDDIYINKITAVNFFGLRIHIGLFKWAFSDVDALILVGNAKWPMVWVTAIFGRLFGKKIIFWSHGWLRDEKSFKAIIRWVFYNISHALIFYNEKAGKIMRKKGYLGKIYTIYNSVGIGYESPKGRQASVPLNPELNYLISVARLIPSRNHEFLFSALHKLKDHCIGLILIGDGPDREKLETLASEMNIEVVFAGACYDPAFLEKMYNLSFASVMTGRVGLSIIQSLQMGVPVIAHSDADDQHPEFEVLENRYNSYLYENGNVADLGRVIRYAQQNPIINCASNCKMSVQFYNPDYQRGVIEKLAKDML